MYTTTIWPTCPSTGAGAGVAGLELAQPAKISRQAAVKARAIALIHMLKSPVVALSRAHRYRRAQHLFDMLHTSANSSIAVAAASTNFE
jgi:hypothetical protein